MAKTKRRLTPLEFRAAWQRAATLGEFLRATGLRKNTAIVRAFRYRKAGVRLKKFHAGGRRPLDVRKLNGRKG